MTDGKWKTTEGACTNEKNGDKTSPLSPSGHSLRSQLSAFVHPPSSIIHPLSVISAYCCLPRPARVALRAAFGRLPRAAFRAGGQLSAFSPQLLPSATVKFISFPLSALSLQLSAFQLTVASLAPVDSLREPLRAAFGILSPYGRLCRPSGCLRQG